MIWARHATTLFLFFNMDSNDGQPSATCIKMPVGCISADENSKQQKCHSRYLPLAQSKHEGLICALGWTFGPYSERSLMSHTRLSSSVPLRSVFFFFFQPLTHTFHMTLAQRRCFLTSPFRLVPPPCRERDFRLQLVKPALGCGAQTLRWRDRCDIVCVRFIAPHGCVVVCCT